MCEKNNNQIITETREIIRNTIDTIQQIKSIADQIINLHNKYFKLFQSIDNNKFLIETHVTPPIFNDLSEISQEYDYNNFLIILNFIDTKLLTGYHTEHLPSYILAVNDIQNKVTISISVLEVFFIKLLIIANKAVPISQALASRIEYSKLKDQANTYCEIIQSLSNHITILDVTNIQILNQTQQGIGSQNNNILHRLAIIDTTLTFLWFTEEISAIGRRKILFRKFIYVLYMIVSFLIILIIDNYDYILTESVLEIPLSIITWGFIGSLAAMIHKYNNTEITGIGSTIRWLIARPLQGILLASAFHLVLFSGSTLLTKIDITEIDEKFFFVLSFLVGFSDRLAETIFTTLVDNVHRFTGNNSQ